MIHDVRDRYRSEISSRSDLGEGEEASTTQAKGQEHLLASADCEGVSCGQVDTGVRVEWGEHLEYLRVNLMIEVTGYVPENGRRCDTGRVGEGQIDELEQA